MTEWEVSWVIEIYADTPEQAARIAMEIQRDPDSMAGAFRVQNTANYNQAYNIDLSDEVM